MGKTIGVILLSIVALICFIISVAQFREKGLLFNNDYLYTSEQKRKAMNKKPYYTQSGIVFLLLGVLF